MAKARLISDAPKLGRQVMAYLKPAGWTREDVGIALMLFEYTHGEKAILAMKDFIDWAEEHNETDLIPVTLGHDLNGCDKPMMYPRVFRHPGIRAKQLAELRAKKVHADGQVV